MAPRPRWGTIGAWSVTKLGSCRHARSQPRTAIREHACSSRSSTRRACIPHLRRSPNPHILALAPPPTLRADWFARHLPYTLSKYGMSMVMLGLSEELRGAGIACNALWPRTLIATAAVEFALGGQAMLRRARSYTGHFALDDQVLAEEGVRDFER